MIDIIIPCFNPTNNLLYTLNSIYQQSYSHFNVILVDDKSTNNYDYENIKKIYDNLYVYYLDENQGPGIARNYGILKSTSKCSNVSG